MLISEIFHSIQGEGVLTGVPSVFVRTSGCNLRCNWCDTPYASWNPEGKQLSVADIVAEVKRFTAARHVGLTGGEPMLAKDLPELAAQVFKLDGEFLGRIHRRHQPSSFCVHVPRVLPNSSTCSRCA